MPRIHRPEIPDSVFREVADQIVAAETPQWGQQTRAVAADLIDTLLRIAAYGLHDSKRDELRQYALAARDALGAADAPKAEASVDPDAIQNWLAGQWHRDQCACDDWPDACIYRHLVPFTWTTDAVVEAIKALRP